MTETRNPVSIKRVMLVDPEHLVASAIAQLIDGTAGFRVALQVENYYEAIQSLEQLEVDVIVSEVRLPGPSGVELVHELKRLGKLTTVILLSSVDSIDVVRRALLAGVQGYVFKSGTVNDLLAALDTVFTGRRFVPPQLGSLPNLPENFYDIGDSSETENSDPLSELTSREREVFHLLATGLTNSVIAKRLYISPRTVETHRARITKKLQLNTNGELIRFAIGFFP